MEDSRLDIVTPAGLREMVAQRLLQIWRTPPEVISRSPFHPLYKCCEAVYLKLLRLDQKRCRQLAKALPCHVVSVGNLVVGGTGKTPLVLHIAAYLSKKGISAGVLSRGYGGSHPACVRVSLQDDLRKAVSLFGDEPVLMSEKGLAVYVGRDRYRAGFQAMQQDSQEVLILDDGFQHTRLRRDLDLVLLDASSPFGNGMTLPFGPLREPIEHLERAHAVILTKAASHLQELQLRARLSVMFPHKPILSCKYRLVSFHRGLKRDEIALPKLQAARATAFSGIAKPAAFFQMLQAMKIDLLECHAFQDHHFFNGPELSSLFARAGHSRIEYVLTTEKDFVRLPAVYREKVVVARVGLDFGEDEARLQELLLDACNKKNHTP